MNTKLLLFICVMALIIGALLSILPYVTIFEDGSWGIGEYPYILSGCLPWAICNEHLYSGQNAGIVWDWGGIEWKGDPGLFFCGGHYNPDTREFGDWWARLLPWLVTDC